MKLGSSIDCNKPSKSDRESAPAQANSDCTQSLNLDHLCERDKNFAIEVALGMAADADWTKIREHANGRAMLSTTEIQDGIRRRDALRWVKKADEAWEKQYGRNNQTQ